MNTMIIRKPKFMRNDALAKTYLEIAETMVRCTDTPDITTDDRYEMLKKCGEFLNKASKAAGFFRTKDFIKWNETRKSH